MRKTDSHFTPPGPPTITSLLFYSFNNIHEIMKYAKYYFKFLQKLSVFVIDDGALFSNLADKLCNTHMFGVRAIRLQIIPGLKFRD